MFVKHLPFELTAYQADFALRCMSNKMNLRVDHDDVIQLYREFANTELVYWLWDDGTVSYSDETPIRNGANLVHFSLPATDWAQENTSETEGG